MTLLLLIRHGENDYVKTGKLAGQISGVHLNQRGRDQARALSDALRGTPISAVYASPLERAMETAQPISESHKLKIIEEPDLMDTNVGKWQGRSWKILRLTKAWQVVQNAPSRFRFPDGESFPEAQTRIVNVLERILQKHRKRQEAVAIIFHADPIKLAVAHFLGLPLDHFQRLSCDTGSLTALFVDASSANLMKLNQRPPFVWLESVKL